MMTLTRTAPAAHALFGHLRLGAEHASGGEILAVTLEDPPEEGKGPIPLGTYRVILSYSRRFQALLPELVAVPGFTGIRIHAGNTKDDTAGCILVGRYQSGEAEIAESRVALGALLTRWPEWHDGAIEIRTAG